MSPTSEAGGLRGESAEAGALLPRGARLDATHVALWNLVVTSLGARTVGPLVARAVVLAQLLEL